MKEQVSLCPTQSLLSYSLGCPPSSQRYLASLTLRVQIIILNSHVQIYLLEPSKSMRYLMLYYPHEIVNLFVLVDNKAMSLLNSLSLIDCTLWESQGYDWLTCSVIFVTKCKPRNMVVIQQTFGWWMKNWRMKHPMRIWARSWVFLLQKPSNPSLTGCYIWKYRLQVLNVVCFM